MAPDTKYLKFNGISYISQKKISKDLAKALGQKSLVYNKSLNTNSLKTAQALRIQQLAYLQNLETTHKINTKYEDVRARFESIPEEQLEYELERPTEELSFESQHLGHPEWESMTKEEEKASGLPLDVPLEDDLSYKVGISYYGRTYEEGKKIGWKDGFRVRYCILQYNLL